MNDAQHQRFVDWLAARLKSAGLTRAFGVPGGGTSLDLLTALRSQDIESVVTAREDAAVMMARVSGRLANAPGLAFTTKGPGLASATNGLASAVLERLPALLVAETFEERELSFLSHQVYDQANLATSLLHSGREDVLAANSQAINAWLSGGLGARISPTVLLADSDALNNPVDEERADSIKQPGIAQADVDGAHDLLKNSRRPVVVVGLEAARPGMAEVIKAFIDRLGAAVLTTYMAKGCVADDDPSYVGVFTGDAIEQAYVREADLIVLLGLDPVELIRKPWTCEAPVLDICETIYTPHYLQPVQRLVGTLNKTLPLLREQLGAAAGPTSWSAAEIANHRTHYFQGMTIAAANGLSSSDVVQAAADIFANAPTGRPRLAVDAGAHMFSACTFWPAREALDVLISNGLATMGFAVPPAIAAALHEPARGAVAITGDGGFMMSFGELKTAFETQANVCIIVFNDGCLSLIDLKRADRQLPDFGLSWKRPDFAVVASAFALPSWRVDDRAQLGPALQAAVAEKGPSLVDVHIDASGYPAQTLALRG